MPARTASWSRSAAQSASPSGRDSVAWGTTSSMRVLISRSNPFITDNTTIRMVTPSVIAASENTDTNDR